MALSKLRAPRIPSQTPTVLVVAAGVWCMALLLMVAAGFCKHMGWQAAFYVLFALLFLCAFLFIALVLHGMFQAITGQIYRWRDGP